MTRQALFIIILLIFQVATQINCVIFGYYNLGKIVGMMVLGALFLNALSFLTHKGIKFWTKKIKIKDED